MIQQIFPLMPVRVECEGGWQGLFFLDFSKELIFDRNFSEVTSGEHHAQLVDFMRSQKKAPEFAYQNVLDKLSAHQQKAKSLDARNLKTRN